MRKDGLVQFKIDKMVKKKNFRVLIDTSNGPTSFTLQTRFESKTPKSKTAKSDTTIVQKEKQTRARIMLSRPSRTRVSSVRCSFKVSKCIELTSPKFTEKMLMLSWTRYDPFYRQLPYIDSHL